jgi:hypothetical protein
MSPIRYRDDESSSGTTVATVVLGALAGFAVGMYVAQRMGGFSGIARRFKARVGDDAERQFDFSGGSRGEFDEEEADEIVEEDETLDTASLRADESDEDFNGMDDTGGEPLIEERVLEAFNNDPILAERAIDIGAMGSGVIELAGWVDSDDEAEHAMTLARGVPGVDTVVNRLMVDEEEALLSDNIRRFKDGDPAMTEARWEGQQVGTGKRRQGSSSEIDRHADPKPGLEDRWLGKSEALKNAAEDLPG